MKEIVAKKYVKAILNENQAELDDFLQNLESISKAFELDKVKSILSLPTLKNSERAKFILSLIENPSSKFINFIKLLAEKKRFELIPAITNELKAQKAIQENIYFGKIYGSFKLNNDEIKALEENFSKKFNAKIKLENTDKSYNGIKIELNDLGVEVSFSVDRLKAQMSEYILKAI